MNDENQKGGKGNKQHNPKPEHQLAPEFRSSLSCWVKNSRDFQCRNWESYQGYVLQESFERTQEKFRREKAGLTQFASEGCVQNFAWSSQCKLLLCENRTLPSVWDSFCEFDECGWNYWGTWTHYMRSLKEFLACARNMTNITFPNPDQKASIPRGARASDVRGRGTRALTSTLNEDFLEFPSI